MGYLVFSVVAAVVIYYMFIRKDDAVSTGAPGHLPETEDRTGKAVGSKAASSVHAQLEYLNTQWALAKREKTLGLPSTFPKWFFDPVTERQLERLKRDDTRVSGDPLSKGAASDLIGLREPVEDGDAEILKFFKLPLKDMNQTIGRYEVKRLLSQPENAAAWAARPAETMQREYLKFFGVPTPKGLTATAAQQLIAAHGEKVEDLNDPKMKEWEAFESIAEELADRETREDYCIKKPSLSAIKDAMSALRSKGEDADDLQLVVDQLIDMKPELARES